jgi:hypothetical protein
MLKWLRSIDWLPLTTSALILVLSIELLSSLGFPNHQRDNRTLPGANQEPIEIPWPDAGGWTAIFTALLTASTFLLWARTRDLALAARETIERDKESREILERSYVSGGGIVDWQDKRFKVHINNHGRTPADLKWIHYGFCSARNPPFTPDYTHCVSWVDSIGPGLRSHLTARIALPLTPADLASQGWAFFARFVYRDIFKGECTAGFIVEIFPGDRLPVPVEASPGYTLRTENGTWSK